MARVVIESSVDDFNMSESATRFFYNVKNTAEEISAIPFTVTKITLAKCLPKESGLYSEVRTILEKNNVDMNSEVSILSHKMVDVINGERRRFSKWGTIEMNYHGSRIRIAVCSTLNRFAILTDNDWKWHRTFSLVSIAAKRKSMTLVH